MRGGILNWPVSTIRLASENPAHLLDAATEILDTWRNYSDESVGILAHTGDTPHNTITPILHYDPSEGYILDIALRNNRTSEEYPDGIFHPHKEYHNIKKENIGLIEVMGLAVLPSRLKAEMADVEAALAAHTPAAEYGENIQKHAEWAMDIIARHPELNAENVHTIVQDEIGHVFAEVLVDAGVYKMDTAGRAGFERFLASI